MSPQVTSWDWSNKLLVATSSLGASLLWNTHQGENQSRLTQAQKCRARGKQEQSIGDGRAAMTWHHPLPATARCSRQEMTPLWGKVPSLPLTSWKGAQNFQSWASSVKVHLLKPLGCIVFLFSPVSQLAPGDIIHWHQLRNPEQTWAETQRKEPKSQSSRDAEWWTALGLNALKIGFLWKN